MTPHLLQHAHMILLRRYFYYQIWSFEGRLYGGISPDINHTGSWSYPVNVTKKREEEKEELKKVLTEIEDPKKDGDIRFIEDTMKGPEKSKKEEIKMVSTVKAPTKNTANEELSLEPKLSLIHI